MARREHLVPVRYYLHLCELLTRNRSAGLLLTVSRRVAICSEAQRIRSPLIALSTEATSRGIDCAN